MNSIVDSLCEQYDSETKQLSEYAKIHIYGQESRFVKALTNKAARLGIECVFKEDEFLSQIPVIVDKETYNKPLTLLVQQDIDYIQHDGLSCCANAILDVLSAIGVVGKHVCIVGRGHAVQGLAKALIKSNATVTVCHSYTEDLFSITKTTDMLIVAAPIYPYQVALENIETIVDVSGTFNTFNGWDHYISNIGKLTTSIILNRVCKKQAI